MQIRAVDESAARPDDDHRRAARAGAVAPAHVAIAAAVMLVAPYLGYDGFKDPRISEVWPAAGVGFVLLTTVWDLPRRWLAAALVGIAAVMTLTAVGFGHDVPAALWTGVVTSGQSLLATVVYRRLRNGRDRAPGWRPERPADLLALVVATVVPCTLVGLVGGYPGVGPDRLDSLLLLWWVVRAAVFCFVSSALFTVLFAPRAHEVLGPAPRWNTALYVAVAAACVVGAYHDPTLPLSWLLLLPSVWAGLTFSVRGSAWASLYVALLAAGMTYVPSLSFGYVGSLPASTIVDLLVMASTGFTLLLALMREQRARLIRELGRRGREAERGEELLRTVLDTMNEGVLLVGRSGVRAHNQAARRLMGGRLPRDPSVEWTSRFGVTDASGRPMSEPELRDLLRDPSAVPTELHLRQDRRHRIVEVVVSRLGHELAEGEQDRPRAVLLRDTTAQQERLRELTDFAGLVAHDLRGPLTVLDGWLELAEEPDDGPEESAAAVAKARDASLRMRQVIEDWLAYTIVQNGQPRPQPVSLAAVAGTVLESRRTDLPGTVNPLIDLDLPHDVDADPGLLRQLVDNLVDNAVKYTEAGRQPVVRLSSHDDEEEGWVRVEVRDEGIGVPEGQEEAIFEEFHRGPADGRTKGTGLGLSLTRRIVTMHGGQMWARRNDGPGSTFVFTLPAG